MEVFQIIYSMMSLILFVSLHYLSTFFTANAIISQEIANPCADAPSESAIIICEQLHKWDKQARVSIINKFIIFDRW